MARIKRYNSGPEICVIGAGSMCFGGAILRDIFTEPKLNGATLVLVDLNQDVLIKMHDLADRLNVESGLGLTIGSTTDRETALCRKPDFVFSALAVKRNLMWRHDLFIPRKHGVHQPLGENGGPGSVMHTIRSVREVFKITEDVKRFCPDAQFINFSNPESRIVCALGRYGGLRKNALGLCHGIDIAQGYVAWRLGIKFEELETLGAGVNHFQWLLSIKEKATGNDLYPLLKQVEADDVWRGSPPDYTCREIFQVYDYWPTCGGSHTAEQWRHGNQFEGNKNLQCVDQADKEGVDFWAAVDKAIACTDNGTYASKLEDWWLMPSGERGVAVIVGMMEQAWTRLPSGVIYNKPGYIRNLPPNIAVEIPIKVGHGRIEGVDIGRLPNELAQCLSDSVSAQDLAVEAAAHVDCTTPESEEKSKQLVLQAILGDPGMVLSDDSVHKNPVAAARAIRDEWWPINKPYMMGPLGS